MLTLLVSFLFCLLLTTYSCCSANVASAFQRVSQLLLTQSKSALQGFAASSGKHVFQHGVCCTNRLWITACCRICMHIGQVRPMTPVTKYQEMQHSRVNSIPINMCACAYHNRYDAPTDKFQECEATMTFIRLHALKLSSSVYSKHPAYYRVASSRYMLRSTLYML